MQAFHHQLKLRSRAIPGHLSPFQRCGEMAVLAGLAMSTPACQEKMVQTRPFDIIVKVFHNRGVASPACVNPGRTPAAKTHCGDLVKKT